MTYKSPIKLISPLNLIVLSALFLLSCSKDQTDIEEEVAQNTPEVYAGQSDATFHQSTFTPNMEIDIIWDSQNLYGEGMDSIDIDGNGTYDLKITLQLLNEDSLHLLSGLPNPFPSCKLFGVDGLEIAFYTESYPIGMGQTGTANFADMLDEGERIDNISNWISSISMWSENPGGAGTPSYGNWYSATSENYLAVKLNGNFGWIKIDGSNVYNPNFITFAIQE